MQRNIFFTSDTHFSHKNIIKYCNRPYDTVDDMNKILTENWNSVVGEEDIVYHLGDFSFANPFTTAEIRKKLNGHIRLVAGNHDWSIQKTRWICEIGMNEVYYPTPSTPLIIDGFMLNHFPYTGDHTEEDRFDKHRPIQNPHLKKQWLLHGHVHEKWRIKDRMFNVGVDVHDYKPISLNQIKEETGNILCY